MTAPSVCWLIFWVITHVWIAGIRIVLNGNTLLNSVVEMNMSFCWRLRRRHSNRRRVSGVVERKRANQAGLRLFGRLVEKMARHMAVLQVDLARDFLVGLAVAGTVAVVVVPKIRWHAPVVCYRGIVLGQCQGNVFGWCGLGKERLGLCLLLLWLGLLLL